MVLYTHSFVLFQTNGYRDITTFLFKNFHSGSLGVSVFFLISGLLLAQSFFTSSSIYSFILKRIFRIFPALLLCICFTIFIIGPLSTEKTLGDYFSSKETYLYLYNAVLNNEYFIFNIPGSFEHNKVPKIINGSLWTLPFELVCYIFLFIILSLFVFVRSKLILIHKVLILAIILFFTVYLFNAGYLHQRIWGLVTGFTYEMSSSNNPLRLFLFFFSGVGLYFLRHIVSFRFVSVLAVALLLFLVRILNYDSLVFSFEYLLIVMTTFFFAGLKPLFKYNLLIDPSYGLYLFAWPIQQLISSWFNLSSYQSMLITLPLTMIIAIFSFKYIERPALNFARNVKISNS